MTKLHPPNRTLTGAVPHDRPVASRPHRFYVAVTNHCNRRCPWCSTCSSPQGRTFLPPATLDRVLPRRRAFEVQLEGGEPTVHPALDRLVACARQRPGCRRLVLVTNGVALPREPAALARWLDGLGAPLTLKLSVNHHLLARDAGLLRLGQRIQRAFRGDGADRQLVLNVRLRPDGPGGDGDVVRAVREAGLLERANVFHLQRYGRAARQAGWEPPFLVGADFTQVLPDGQVLGPDLLARTEAMRQLP